MPAPHQHVYRRTQHSQSSSAPGNGLGISVPTQPAAPAHRQAIPAHATPEALRAQGRTPFVVNSYSIGWFPAERLVRPLVPLGPVPTPHPQIPAIPPQNPRHEAERAAALQQWVAAQTHPTCVQYSHPDSSRQFMTHGFPPQMLPHPVNSQHVLYTGQPAILPSVQQLPQAGLQGNAGWWDATNHQAPGLQPPPWPPRNRLERGYHFLHQRVASDREHVDPFLRSPTVHAAQPEVDEPVELALDTPNPDSSYLIEEDDA